MELKDDNMFLHIGMGKIVNKKDIVGIFDLETTSTEKKTREFLKINEKKGLIINVSEEIPKTYIVCEKKRKKDIFISQISSQTLYKRAERNENFGSEN